jgi:hypothetical protein
MLSGSRNMDLEQRTIIRSGGFVLPGYTVSSSVIQSIYHSVLLDNSPSVVRLRLAEHAPWMSSGGVFRTRGFCYSVESRYVLWGRQDTRSRKGGSGE